ncbi:MAG: hypothetical protein CMN91_12220 [Synechococcus sp. ARS1019]|nr:hypothetical protein [Synechococcus sp. ARS1019]|tara:strand:- start:395 stop:1051 length:657 start_codon:yes stop_codon:yes gene_type:complete
MIIKSIDYNLPHSIRGEDFIMEMPKSLSKDFCKSVIEKFELDDRKQDGCVGTTSDPIVKKNVKVTTDLPISDKDDWKEEDEVFFKALSAGMDQYVERCAEISDNILDLQMMLSQFSMEDTGYQIQRYQKNSGWYTWHHDYTMSPQFGPRQFTYLWYLNTIKDGSGCTEFSCGKSVTPKAGKLIIFPSTWQYLHRACPTVNKRKYICTGWIYTRSKENA